MYTGMHECLVGFDLHTKYPAIVFIDTVGACREQSGGLLPHPWRNLGEKSYTRQSA